MKRFFVAILALIYISTTIGATVHMHYCMGKLADWGFSYNKSKKCSRCGMEETDNKDNGCCRDKHKFLKNDTDQKTTGSAFQLIKLIALAIPASFVEIPYNVFTSIAEVNPASNAPPPGRSVAVYIRNCVFLI